MAPSVRVINLSIGDEARLFERQMSPWARLLDWLSFRYSVLFIVSAGNDMRALSLDTPSHTLEGLTAEQRSALAFTAMTTEHIERRLLAPAAPRSKFKKPANPHINFYTVPNVCEAGCRPLLPLPWKPQF